MHPHQRLLPALALRHPQPQGLHRAARAAGPPVRPAGRLLRLHPVGPHDGIPLGRDFAQKVGYRGSVRTCQRQQHRQGRRPLPRLQPGQVRGRQPHPLSRALQRHIAPLAQGAQLRGDGGHVVGGARGLGVGLDGHVSGIDPPCLSGKSIASEAKPPNGTGRAEISRPISADAGISRAAPRAPTRRSPARRAGPYAHGGRAR